MSGRCNLVLSCSWDLFEFGGYIVSIPYFQQGVGAKTEENVTVSLLREYIDNHGRNPNQRCITDMSFDIFYHLRGDSINTFHH